MKGALIPVAEKNLARDAFWDLTQAMGLNPSVATRPLDRPFLWKAALNEAQERLISSQDKRGCRTPVLEAKKGCARCEIESNGIGRPTSHRTGSRPTSTRSAC